MSAGCKVWETVCRIFGVSLLTYLRPWCIGLGAALVTLSFGGGALAEGKASANHLRAALFDC